jgi:hypothetical protein
MSVVPEARTLALCRRRADEDRAGGAQMSTVDERDLSEQLSGVLDAITPSAAPVDAALRNGKLIRARRNVGITAGLAVAAGLVVAVPGLLHHPAHPGVSPTVTVRQVCPSVRRGVRGPTRQPEVVGRAGGLPAAELVAGRAAGLPAAELAAGRCAWLMP